MTPTALATPPAAPLIRAAIARAIAPRRPLAVSDWADAEMVISRKQGPEPGKWRTSRNPVLREPMDVLSSRSAVTDVALQFPIQFGKTSIALNWIGYTMDHDPGPMMVVLPADVPMQKWVAQKLNPMLEETPAVRRAMTSVVSRESANRRTFKDFAGGQLYIEHAGSPARLKSTSVRKLIVDELDEFATNLSSGDDPIELLNGRTSAYASRGKRLYISTPGIEGVSRISGLYKQSDQRLYEVPCPHCGEEQPIEWAGLQWSPDLSHAWYCCRECGSMIDEAHKTDIIARGRWVPQNPGARIRGYHVNGLYYPQGLGPTWLTLARMWKEAQGDPAKLKTFINDRLAQTWEDPAMRKVKHASIVDRAEPYALREAPEEVLAITAGVDTQDDRLEGQLLGWGRGMRKVWTLDYIQLPGDPAGEDVWLALTDWLSRPVSHAWGGVMLAEAVAIDAGGHRTEHVYNYVRSRKVRRPMAIFGAVSNAAPVISRGKLQDVNFRGKLDPKGVKVFHTGTVGIKHHLYSMLSMDADRDHEERAVHLSDQLPDEYFGGLVAEVYNPTRNRFERRRNAPRNEPLDTWVYAYTAAHHPELRLHRLSKAEWDAREARLRGKTPDGPAPTPAPPPAKNTTQSPAPAGRGWGRGTDTGRGWGR